MTVTQPKGGFAHTTRYVAAMANAQDAIQGVVKIVGRKPHCHIEAGKALSQAEIAELHMASGDIRRAS